MKHAARLTAALLLVLTTTAACRAQAKKKDWGDAFYKRFTPAKFSRYAPAKRKIDFKACKIDAVFWSH